MLISTIIVVYRPKKEFFNNLKILFNEKNFDSEVIIVDNSGNQALVDEFVNYGERILYIRNLQNQGFAVAINQGIRRSSGKFILTLNEDVVLAPDFISELKRKLTLLDPNVGSISPKILSVDGKEIDSTGISLTFLRRFYDRGRGSREIRKFDQLPKIFGPSAAAAVYRRSALEDTKIFEEYFDEDFFLILEDVDLAWRMNRYGWKGIYFAELTCYHLGGISRKNTKLGRYYTFRNRYLLLIKNEKILNIFLGLFSVFWLYDFPHFFYLLITDSLSIQGIKEIIGKFSSMLKKRYLIQAALRSKRKKIEEYGK